MANADVCGAALPRQAKYQELLDAARGINSIIDHLTELHNVLGVSHMTDEKQSNIKEAKEPSLVSVLDDLPSELNQAHARIHDMINSTMNQLN